LVLKLPRLLRKAACADASVVRAYGRHPKGAETHPQSLA
jgi:hypothetical protein